MIFSVENLIQYLQLDVCDERAFDSSYSPLSNLLDHVLLACEHLTSPRPLLANEKRNLLANDRILNTPFRTEIGKWRI